MHVTLINPSWIFPSRNSVVISQCLGLRYLSATLKARGVQEITFLDALMLGFSEIKPYAQGLEVGLSPQEIVSRIPPQTDWVGINGPFSQSAPIVHEIVKVLRKRWPHMKVVLGGVYPSTQPALALSSGCDAIVVGEGEKAIAAMVEGSPFPWRNIPGVYTQEDASRPHFSSAPSVENLDDLPFPDLDIPSIEKYYELSPRGRIGRTASLLTSRGCPFACEFCSIHPVYGRGWRGRSPENVLEEIRILTDRFGVDVIEFEDDNFTLNKERTLGILEGIVRMNEKGKTLSWTTPNGVRLDTLDREMVALFKRSNCSGVNIALEHGDREMLEIMGKKLDLDKAYSVVDLLCQTGIPVVGLFYITGYPGETTERFRSGLAFLKRLKRLGKGNLYLTVHYAQPYPGTPLLDRCKKNGWVTDEHYDDFLVRRDLMSTDKTISILTPEFSREEVERRKILLQCVLPHGRKQKIMSLVPSILRPAAVRVWQKIRTP